MVVDTSVSTCTWVGLPTYLPVTNDNTKNLSAGETLLLLIGAVAIG
jgi:hypothetical protein